MTKVKFSGLVTGMRGKLSGSVLTANKSGNTIRTKTIPVNRETSSLSKQRSSMSELSRMWRELTQNQRDAWIGATPDFVRLDVFGDPYEMSGFNLYVLINRNRILTNNATTGTAPGPEVIVSLTSLSLAGNTAPDTLEATFTASPTDADTTFLIFASRQLPPGIQAAKKHLRLIHILSGTSGSPTDLIDAYQGVFPPALEVGKKIFIKYKPISTINFYSGVEWNANAIIT